MIALLREVRKKVVIGFVGGSDLVKIEEQLGVAGNKGACFLDPMACSVELIISPFPYYAMQLLTTSTMDLRRTA